MATARKILGENEAMLKGTVKWFNSQKGYGFIAREDGESDAFVHISAVQRAGLDGLAEGAEVRFELARQRNGKLAVETIELVA